jgi:hypothetical protein
MMMVMVAMGQRSHHIHPTIDRRGVNAKLGVAAGFVLIYTLLRC